MSGHRHVLPGDSDANTWDDAPENRRRNAGWGLCNTGSGKRTICAFGGIGCNVDHVTIRRRADQRVRAASLPAPSRVPTATVAKGLLPPVVSRAIWVLRTCRCDCHWQEPYGRVVAAGCPRHD